MPTIKPKRPSEFKRVPVNMTRNLREDIALLLGRRPNSPSTQPKFWTHLGAATSHHASVAANQRNVYFRSDMNAALRKLAASAHCMQIALAESRRVLGGIAHMWGIEQDFLEEQCEIIRTVYAARLAKGTMGGGERRWYTKQIATAAREASSSFFDHWAQRESRTNVQFTQDRRSFMEMYRAALELRGL